MITDLYSFGITLLDVLDMLDILDMSDMSDVFSGPFRYYSIFVLLFVTIRRFGGPWCKASFMDHTVQMSEKFSKVSLS